jgi:hypothetical protein
MIISHGRRYIFIHPPKTGGTSFALALEGRAMKDDIMLGDTPKARRRRHRVKDVKTTGRLWKHSTLRDIYGLVSQDQIDNYFVVSLVRNPWDRLVSYYHWLKMQKFDHPVVGLAQNLNFSDFLDHSVVTQSFQTGTYGSYVTDATGQERCDLFIRIEHLRENLIPFEEHLGFSLGDIAHDNRSDRDADYRRYYSSQDVDHVAQICAQDIARFGYSF